MSARVDTVRLGRSRATSAFFSKEILEVVRQPWLLAVMLVGPFLVLGAFGLAYRNDVQPYRVVFVGDPKSALAQRIDNAAQGLDQFIRYRGTTPDEAAARRQLDRGKVDAYVVLPPDPVSDVLAGKQSTLRIVHEKLDPIQQTAIAFASRIAVDDINAKVVSDVVSQGQDVAQPLTGSLDTARSLVDQMVNAVDGQNAAAIDNAGAQLAGVLTWVDAGAAAAQRFADQAGQAGGDLAARAATFSTMVARARSTLDQARQSLQSGKAADARAQLLDLRQQLDQIAPLAGQLVNVQAAVLVQPFTEHVDGPGGRASDYYAVAAVILLLQQFGVAFGALTFVRERTQGIIDVYRLSPVRPVQALAGKYGAYLVLGLGVGAVLLGLVTAVARVPFNGKVLDAAIVMVLVLLGGIGIGFLISIFSRTDTQAVLLSMLVLLASLFFSGLFIPVNALRWPIRAVCYVIPATYGNAMLRHVALRGASPAPTSLAGAAVLALVVAVLVSMRTSRQLRGG
jgi:ABC-2 type transport system permease protein